MAEAARDQALACRKVGGNFTGSERWEDTSVGSLSRENDVMHDDLHGEPAEVARWTRCHMHGVQIPRDSRICRSWSSISTPATGRHKEQSSSNTSQCASFMSH
ncbi:hypothetical protein SISNIDRAFT_30862 [Sistotremastrum niveocremeum HHB9708]|uniref:Uncharacterized protein n=1 Tax=Sistotremastrum niveocremeum HHB9708 TaxID=1314777 RepID=A0A164W5F0_9AGAM|nr:hypothetical protein SISNIDRAFT_30862 [Sistotremastrum niveocremeum HHB9708]